MFHAIQMHARSALVLAFHGFSRWLEEHCVDYPSLTRDHGVAVSIVGERIEFLQRSSFLDTARITGDAGVRARRDGNLLFLDAELRSKARAAARVSLVLRPVLIDEEKALSALPGPLPPALLARWKEDELLPTS